MVRQLHRLLWVLTAACLILLSGSLSAGAATFVVDSTADVADANVGDGFCNDGSGACTLRAAIQEANATVEPDVVDLAGIDAVAGPIVLSIDGVDEDWDDNPLMDPNEPYVVVDDLDASIGDLDITESLTIQGAGYDQTVIQWSEASKTDGDPATGDRIFQVRATDSVISVVIEDVRLANGSVGVEPSTDPGNPYNIEINPDDTIWQFRRMGGAIALGPGAAVVLFEPEVHGGSDAGGGGLGPFPPGGPGEEEEGGSISDVTLTRVAIVGNQSGADAGGIYNTAPLDLVDSVVSGNDSGANGGGLYIDADTSIVNTTIGSLPSVPEFALGNTAENGGGFFATGVSVTDVVGTSIVGNEAVGGGAIAARTGPIIDIVNTTVSGNRATDVGGGITTNGTITIRNSTIADNGADSDAGFGGGGVNSFGRGTYVLGNTLLTNNFVGMTLANCGCTGGTCVSGQRIISQGNNLEDADTCGFILGVDITDTDPEILPLADNGGLTETHDLSATSPALDAGSDAICAALILQVGDTDQRGESRVLDGDLDGTAVCDIGAVERLTTECNDGVDNDLDGFADLADPSCVDERDTSERGPDYACDDGIDNDSDGLADFPDDPECTGPTDTSEFASSDPDDCKWCDSEADLEGPDKLKIPDIVVNKDILELDIEIENLEWLATDGDGNVYSGTYKLAKRNRKKLKLAFNDTSLAKLVELLEVRASDSAGVPVRLKVIDPPKFIVKISDDKTSAIAKIEIPLKGITDDLKSKGLYKAELEGPFVRGVASP